MGCPTQHRDAQGLCLCGSILLERKSATRATQAPSIAEKPIREVESPRSHLNLSCVQLDIWTLPPYRETAWQAQPCFTSLVHPFEGASIAPQDIQQRQDCMRLVKGEDKGFWLKALKKHV